ncbi:hypothetical protein D5F53_29315 [Paenibacillus lautus]|uniref:YopX protein domain-containing protein n=1 Tax=Paenibacillus lautus TaxID=1401 RepID=A0A385TYC1_PAELA|nr:hypothetical protein D5F53_29315 [Paenibacillus lautus]
MREIKFRGKRIDNGEWVYGSYTHCRDVDGNPSIIPFRANYHVPVDRETVGQYTGLSDRNGKEIYEGDIREGDHAIYLIEWNAEKAQYQAKAIQTKTVLIKHCSFPLWQYVEDDGKCRFVVIGNRWDNPDLLEG